MLFDLSEWGWIGSILPEVKSHLLHLLHLSSAYQSVLCGHEGIRETLFGRFVRAKLLSQYVKTLFAFFTVLTCTNEGSGMCYYHCSLQSTCSFLKSQFSLRMLLIN